MGVFTVLWTVDNQDGTHREVTVIDCSDELSILRFLPAVCNWHRGMASTG